MAAPIYHICRAEEWQAAQATGFYPGSSQDKADGFMHFSTAAQVHETARKHFVAGGNNLQYDTTKAAVAGLTRGLAMDHSPEGIRVNAVCPGPIFTPFHARRLQAAGKTVAEYNEDAAQRTMLKRPGTAEEVAACALFLASDDASYVTGTLLFVDGGMTAL